MTNYHDFSECCVGQYMSMHNETTGYEYFGRILSVDMENSQISYQFTVRTNPVREFFDNIDIVSRCFALANSHIKFTFYSDEVHFRLALQ